MSSIIPQSTNNEIIHHPEPSSLLFFSLSPPHRLSPMILLVPLSVKISSTQSVIARNEVTWQSHPIHLYYFFPRPLTPSAPQYLRA